jgi:hypothetical protein
MRAILFASATVTSLTGRRARTPLVRVSAALFHWGAQCTIDVAPSTSNLRISWLPALVIRPRQAVPSVEYYCGTRPSQVAKCRALLNRLMSVTVAAIKEAVTGPIPGSVARRRTVSLFRTCATIAVSKVSTLAQLDDALPFGQ